MPEKNTADLILSVLEKNKGFMTTTSLVSSLSADAKRAAGLKNKDSGKIVQRKIEKSAEGSFIFRSRGRSIYILVPCEPSEFVLGLLSENKAFDTRTIRGLPFTKSEFVEIINALAEEGRVIVNLGADLKPRIYRAPDIRKPAGNTGASASENDSGQYTQEKFREAFGSCDKGRTFVRIFKMRRYLNWPREVFDDMVMRLLKEGKIFVHPAEPTVLKPDEYEDSFRDEFGDMNGTVTWND